ncbi:MAG: GTP cyclohydrolase II [Rhodospirillales bacterium]
MNAAWSLASPYSRVNRAIAELRRGAIVLVTGADGSAALVQAAEYASEESLDSLRHVVGNDLMLAVTARRAGVLGLSDAETGSIALSLPRGFPAKAVRALADPAAVLPGAVEAPARAVPGDEDSYWNGAVALARAARLLPAALLAPGPAGSLQGVASDRDLLRVSTADVRAFQATAGGDLTVVGDAAVPLIDAEEARIVAFRPADGGKEHLAIVIGEPQLNEPVLIRLHSECFTGDLLGSLRCDCGDQLRGAIDAIASAGAGILLYLAQEGRGIGLINKLRAYELQDRGADTVEANEMLGFDSDERIYLPAAEMLRSLGVRQVRLMTNNPLKVEALQEAGVTVAERVPHIFPSNDHNAFYIDTKARKSGHLF